MNEQVQFGPSDDATVVLDIGGDVGALIIVTGPELLGTEIDISPLDATAEDVFQAEHPHHHGDGEVHSHDHPHGPDGVPRTHVAVRERRGAGTSRFAAIYPGLREGRYTVWGVDGSAADTVHITGGEVAELDWR